MNSINTSWAWVNIVFLNTLNISLELLNIPLVHCTHSREYFTALVKYSLQKEMCSCYQISTFFSSFSEWNHWFRKRNLASIHFQFSKVRKEMAVWQSHWQFPFFFCATWPHKRRTQKQREKQSSLQVSANSFWLDSLQFLNTRIKSQEKYLMVKKTHKAGLGAFLTFCLFSINTPERAATGSSERPPKLGLMRLEHPSCWASIFGPQNNAPNAKVARTTFTLWTDDQCEYYVEVQFGSFPWYSQLDRYFWSCSSTRKTLGKTLKMQTGTGRKAVLTRPDTEKT